MMAILEGVALCVVLFLIYGLLRPRAGGCDGSGGCGACHHGSCPFSESSHEHPRSQ